MLSKSLGVVNSLGVLIVRKVELVRDSQMGLGRILCAGNCLILSGTLFIIVFLFFK